MKSTWWKSGDYNALCDVCGFKFKASKLKERWDGLMVCSEDWETRHPQDFIRPPQAENKLPWTRPEPTDTQVQDLSAYNVVISVNTTFYQLCSASTQRVVVVTINSGITLTELVVRGRGQVVINNYGTLTYLVATSGDGTTAVDTSNITVNNLGGHSPSSITITKNTVAVSTTLTIASGFNYAVTTPMTNAGTIVNSGTLTVSDAC